MEISIMRGIAFFGVVFIASLFLSPGWVLAFMPRGWQTWAVRRWTDRLWARMTILLTAIFVTLSAWLICSVHRNTPDNDRETRVSSGAKIGIVGMRAWP